MQGLGYKEAVDYKNHILAKAIINIMYTNQTSSKIRDQIFEILTDSCLTGFTVCLTAFLFDSVMRPLLF